MQTSAKPVVGFNDLKIKSQFLLQDNQQQTVQTVSKTNASEATTIVVYHDIELTTQRVLDAVKTFADEKNKAGNKQLFATLTASKINLIEKTIVIEINNEAQNEMLNNIKQDMLDTLRNKLSNKLTQLEIKVSAVALEIKAYKPADKFKLMSEKNPALLELKKRFDLDIEY